MMPRNGPSHWKSPHFMERSDHADELEAVS